MPRNTCTTCRAENLVTAVVCVACGTIFDDRRAAGPSAAAEAAWTPPMPVRPVAERRHAPALSIVRDRDDASIPPRPDER
jgi:hypothetical protein